MIYRRTIKWRMIWIDIFRYYTLWTCEFCGVKSCLIEVIYSDMFPVYKTQILSLLFEILKNRLVKWSRFILTCAIEFRWYAHHSYDSHQNIINICIADNEKFNVNNLFQVFLCSRNMIMIVLGVILLYM